MGAKEDLSEVRAAVLDAMSLMPKVYKEMYKGHCSRVAEEISWIYEPGRVVVDLGGGVGFHSMVCCLLGMKAYNVDFFRLRPKEDGSSEHRFEAEEIAKKVGAKFIHTDLLEWDPPFEQGSIDAVMSFDNIEHLHHSPRRLYNTMFRCLKPAGLFLLGAPNAANILKRLRVPIGMNIFARLDDWYQLNHFVGHVREPIVADLMFIGKDIGLDNIRIIGRNWLGIVKFGVWGRVVDPLLRVFPSLCSDIYLIGNKPRK
ncbi:MAG: methyltransferase domain-containing protein [Nitrospirae bacterium]|nr:methyltransferase domain-containing protein [Nitrospirota bacterium]